MDANENHSNCDVPDASGISSPARVLTSRKRPLDLLVDDNGEGKVERAMTTSSQQTLSQEDTTELDTELTILVTALRDENKHLRSSCDELIGRCQDLVQQNHELQNQIKDLTLEKEYHEWSYSAEAVPRWYWTTKGYSIEYANGVWHFLGRIKDFTHQLRRGERIDRMNLSSTIRLEHDGILLPHWREFANALVQYQKFAHRKDHNINMFCISCIDLHSSVLGILLPALEATSVKYFALNSNHFRSNEGIFFVASIARSCPNLEGVGWIGNRVDSAEAMQELCSSFASVQKCIIVQNSFDGNDQEVLKAILNTNNRAGVALDLARNGIAAQGAAVIADFLATNPLLHALHLNDNHLSDADAEVLANALEFNTNLTRITVDGNHITQIGRKHMLHALFDPTSLDSCTASNHTCWISGVDVNKRAPEVNRAMKIFTVMSAADQGFFSANCLCGFSYELVPKLLRLAQEFDVATPELSAAYEEQTGKKTADWNSLANYVDNLALTSVFELFRSWVVPAMP